MLLKLNKVGVVMGLGERPDALERADKRVATYERKYYGAHLGIGRCLIKKNASSVAQLECRGVEIAKRAQARFLRRGLGLREHRGDDRVEQVDDVVPGGGLERMDKGEERGGAPIVGESRDGLRFGCRREPRSAATLPGGKLSICGRSSAILRISPKRTSARPISGPLWMYGPSRRRSKVLWRSPSGTITRPSRRSRCEGVTPLIRRR